MQDKFRMIENKVIKWFIKNYYVNFRLSEFKYITYILTKKLLKEWENEKQSFESIFNYIESLKNEL